MLIANRFSIERWKKIVDGAIVMLLSLALVSLLFVVGLAFSGSEKRAQACFVVTEEKRNFEEVELSAAVDLWIPLPEIEERVVFFGADRRPGMEGGVWLGVEGGEKNLYHVGDKIFLECKDQRQIAFSADPTPFWLEIRESGEKVLEALFGSEYKTEEGEILFSSTKELALKERSWRGANRGGPLENALHALSKIRCYGPDQLLELYGGAVFSEMKGRPRVDLEGKGEKIYFLTGDNERFFWSGEKWLPMKEEREGDFILWLEKIEGSQCHFVLFDAEGYTVESLSIAFQKPVVSSSKSTELFTALRSRSRQSVLCKLAQHNMILRKGDWLLRVKNGWRNLQTSEELKKYLCYALKGELFVFDQIVATNSGYLFTGHLFDEKRTSVQKIELPLGDKKILKKSGKPGNMPSLPVPREEREEDDERL